jgi:hypothetical protein
MNKTNFEDYKTSCNVLKEYQAIIRKLQEDIYTMKNSKTVQDEILKSLSQSSDHLSEQNVIPTQKSLKSSLKQAHDEIIVKNDLIAHYEIELKSLYAAYKDSELKSSNLSKELNFYKDSLKSYSTLKPTTPTPDLHQKNDVTKTHKISSKPNFQTELDDKISEIQELNKQLSILKNDQKINIKKEELQEIILTKDEQLKKMNIKFLAMNQKIDGLIKDKETLVAENKSLENDKKKLIERWKE